MLFRSDSDDDDSDDDEDEEDSDEDDDSDVDDSDDDEEDDSDDDSDDDEDDDSSDDEEDDELSPTLTSLEILRSVPEAGDESAQELSAGDASRAELSRSVGGGSHDTDASAAESCGISQHDSRPCWRRLQTN